MAPPFFTSALDEGEWSVSRPSRFTPGESRLGGGARAGVDAMEKRKTTNT
jgi:hypothetical protein